MADGTWGGVDFSAEQVLITHGRTRIEGCHCGWGMDGSKLGQSHALHVWRELQRNVLPAHDARTREHERQRIAEALAPLLAESRFLTEAAVTHSLHCDQAHAGCLAARVRDVVNGKISNNGGEER